ncbi:PREDICTED: nucleolin 1-like [Camelina sativa]|uniref:Nucleolin 1-like n=1 Tax=Camelina sativa TaxID=90675 RepID=A0ABM1QD34_CAMSA|nr:PREDICTED: nucleolin 1-like [Camelina sativa]
MEIQGDEGTGQKVLELNGSDVGGWNVVVHALPNQGPDSAFCPKAAAFRAQSKRKNQSTTFLVSGFDTSLPEAYIERSLSKCFSSCGEITGISLTRGVGGVLKSYAFISILGEGASEKALKLNGSDAGGWKVSVVVLRLP